MFGSWPLTFSHLYPILSLLWLPWRQEVGFTQMPLRAEAFEERREQTRQGVDGLRFHMHTTSLSSCTLIHRALQTLGYLL